MDDKGKIPKKAVVDRLKEMTHEVEAIEERKILGKYAVMLEQESAAKSRLKAAQGALEAKLAKQYGKFTETEIKTLVIGDKWLAKLAADVHSELDRVSRALTGRIRQLAERYATPLPQITQDVKTLATRVDEHLRQMGAVWD